MRCKEVHGASQSRNTRLAPPCLFAFEVELCESSLQHSKAWLFCGDDPDVGKMGTSLQPTSAFHYCSTGSRRIWPTNKIAVQLGNSVRVGGGLWASHQTSSRLELAVSPPFSHYQAKLKCVVQLDSPSDKVYCFQSYQILPGDGEKWLHKNRLDTSYRKSTVAGNQVNVEGNLKGQFHGREPVGAYNTCHT